MQFNVLNELRQHTEDLACFAPRIKALEKVVLSAVLWPKHRVHPKLIHAGQVVLASHVEFLDGCPPIKGLNRPKWVQFVFNYKVFIEQITAAGDVVGSVG